MALAKLPQRLNTIKPLRENPILVTQGKAVRHLFRVRLVKCFAKFTAVNFRVLPDLGLHFLGIVVPPFEMSGAEFSLGIFLIAGALPGLSHFDFLFRWRSLGRGGSSSRSGRGCWRCRGWSCGRGPLRCGFLGHSSVPLSGQDALPVSLLSSRVCILLEPFPRNQARLWQRRPRSTIFQLASALRIIFLMFLA